jgi:hypothetical protein
MKTFGNFLLISFLAVSLLSGCSKKDDDNTEPETNTPTTALTCKVNGTSWPASLAVVATNSGGILTVTGSDSNAKQCQVIIYDANGAGTYTLGGSLTNPNTGRWTEGLNATDTYTTSVGLGEGTAEITELTATSVKGTFQFTAKNTEGTGVTITEGSFDAKF